MVQVKEKWIGKTICESYQTGYFEFAKTPTAYAIRYKNVRIAYQAVFPYAIHFYIDEQQNIIVITAIVFAGRDPDFAKSRI